MMFRKESEKVILVAVLIIGQSNRNINADQVIWKFFQSNPMPLA